MFYLGWIHGRRGRPARELSPGVVLGVAVLVNRAAPSDGLRWRRRRGCGLPSGTPGIIELCCNLDWEMEPGGSDGRAASASWTFCMPAMAALGGLPFLGRRSLRYAGARRLSSVARWPGGSVGVPGLVLGRGRRRKVAANCEAQPPDHPSGRATTRRWRPPECVGGGLSPRGTRRDALVCASILQAASSRLVFVAAF